MSLWPRGKRLESPRRKLSEKIIPSGAARFVAEAVCCDGRFGSFPGDRIGACVSTDRSAVFFCARRQVLNFTTPIMENTTTRAAARIAVTSFGKRYFAKDRLAVSA